MTKTDAGDAAYDVSFHGTSITLPLPSNPPSKLVDMRGSCEVCHTDQRIMTNGTKPPLKTAVELLDYVRKIQDSTKAAMTKIQGRLVTNNNKDEKTMLRLSNAQANLNMILMDGSMGAHNSRISLKGVVTPEGGVADCLRLANIWVELSCREAGANCTGEIYNPISGPLSEPNPPLCLAQ